MATATFDTHANLLAGQAELKNEIVLSESRLKHDLTVRMGVMLMATVGVLFGLMRMLVIPPV